jgi:hypothetical protein
LWTRHACLLMLYAAERHTQRLKRQRRGACAHLPPLQSCSHAIGALMTRIVLHSMPQFPLMTDPARTHVICTPCTAQETIDIHQKVSERTYCTRLAPLSILCLSC